MTRQELIDRKYPDRGGWNGVVKIAHDPKYVSPDDRLIAIKNQYHVSLKTALRWLRDV